MEATEFSFYGFIFTWFSGGRNGIRELMIKRMRRARKRERETHFLIMAFSGVIYFRLYLH